MTDNEIITTIAEAMGWTIQRLDDCIGTTDENAKWTSHLQPAARHPFLNSRDALQPVIEKMTEEQKTELSNRLYLSFLKDPVSEINLHFYFLTIPPRTLAEVVAEVIRDSKGTK